MAKKRRRQGLVRAVADELGVTTPRGAKRRRPTKKRVRAKSFRAGGD
jgi:hypothetical protein